MRSYRQHESLELAGRGRGKRRTDPRDELRSKRPGRCDCFAKARDIVPIAYLPYPRENDA
jgi:hypothetical protein